MPEKEATERFVQAFKEVESHIKKKVGHGGDRLQDAIDKYESKFSQPSWLKSFKMFKGLRNVISHDPKFAYPLFSASEEAATEMERILEQVTHPVTVGTKYGRRVETVQRSTELQDVLSRVATLNISQFPVVDGKNVMGILTENGLMFWLSRNYEKPSWITEFRTHKVDDILEEDEQSRSSRFIARDEPAESALLQFNRQPGLVALLVTHNGRNGEGLLGIITASDFARP